jgi:2-oxoglutarate ferredoxin oxidoreductase subunit beta
MNNKYDVTGIDIAWCPGCGNYMLLKILKQVFTEMELDQKKLVLVSGIGQAAKMPQYLNVNYFNGLHGRSLPVATAIKASNPELTVIAESGDGDMYGEGGNHFIHCIRRNPDIVHIVHNNQIYGLTKGQASPTTLKGQKTTLQLEGVNNEPFNPLSVALSLGASFVARSFTGEADKTRQILKAAIKHKGYALVDVFDPCVSFNRVNTFKWYKENTCWLGKEHDPKNRLKALEKSFETGKYPLGIFYQKQGDSVFSEKNSGYRNYSDPLFKREIDMSKIKSLYSRE